MAGTRCNLACHHCFISCSPRNETFGFLSFEEVCRRLEESVPSGVKEYYFTGGEPFLNPDLGRILVETLRYGPATVLTNGTVLKDPWLEKLAEAAETSPYSLEFRVSIDGFSAEMNDPIRGEGTFQRALQGIARRVRFGFLPIITAARTWPVEQDPAMTRGFLELLQQLGYDRPRVKLLPTLKLGAEAERTCGYRASERVTEAMMDGFDPARLVCEHSRVVSDRGVHVCPILIESPDSLLGHSLVESRRPFAIRHGACFTCYQFGAICSNPSSTAACDA